MYDTQTARAYRSQATEASKHGRAIRGGIYGPEIPHHTSSVAFEPLTGWKAADWEFCDSWGDPLLRAAGPTAWSSLMNKKKLAPPGAKRRKWTRDCAKLGSSPSPSPSL